MSKTNNDDVTNFAAQNAQSTHTPMRKTPPNAMQGIFETDLPLPSSMANEIDRLMLRDCKPMDNDSAKAKELGYDLEKLKEITGAIRGIIRQGAYLLGKNVHDAKEILHKHGKGEKTFTEWLNIAFAQSRRTAYNALTFYEFHEELPNKTLKDRLKEIPQKAAYVLASRDGDIERKVEILENYANQKAVDLINLIDETFPLPENDQRKRKDNDEVSVRTLFSTVKKLQRQDLTREILEEIKDVRNLINEILEYNTSCVDEGYVNEIYTSFKKLSALKSGGEYLFGRDIPKRMKELIPLIKEFVSKDNTASEINALNALNLNDHDISNKNVPP